MIYVFNIKTVKGISEMHGIYILSQQCCTLGSRGRDMSAREECLKDMGMEKWQGPQRFRVVVLPLV